jgi:hypothetical protein
VRYHETSTTLDMPSTTKQRGQKEDVGISKRSDARAVFLNEAHLFLLRSQEEESRQAISKANVKLRSSSTLLGQELDARTASRQLS